MDAEGCGAAVICGDLFDTVRPEPQVIAAVQRSLGAFGGHWYILAGNHDIASTDDGDHALGPLAVIPRVTVITGKARRVEHGDVTLMLVPFAPGNAEQKITDAIMALDHRDVELRPAPMSYVSQTVLCIHAGIRGQGEDAPWQVVSEDAVSVKVAGKLAALAGAAYVVAGNWHNPTRSVSRHWGAKAGAPEIEIMQVGALVPTGFDNPGDGYGRWGMLETSGGPAQLFGSGGWVKGPRFLTNRNRPIVPQVDEARKLGHAVYVSIADDTIIGREAALAWLERMKRDGLIVDGEVKALDADTVWAATTPSAALGEKNTTLLEVRKYVHELHRAQGQAWAWGTPGDVADRAVAYLSNAWEGGS